MSPSALIVAVLDRERNGREEYVFAHSPIRVGRSPLNDLPLDRPFVSHCHGVYYFDTHNIEFTDLGSTNGSFVAGRRLGKNRRTLVAPSECLEIGPLQLTARVEKRKTGDTRASYAFGAAAAASPSSTTTANRATAPSGPVERSPEAQRFEHEGKDRSMRLLERFAESFLELRRGQAQLVRDLGVTPPLREKLHSIESARELLEYLLDSRADESRLDELSRAYADLMMHEIALLSATSAGARDLLEELSPCGLAPSFGGAFTFVARLFGRDPRWSALRRKHEELQEETALSSVVLGRAFARAYLSALGTPRGERRARPDASSR